jgi:hypothetical protein
LLYAGQHDSKYLPLWKRIHFSGQFVVMQELPGNFTKSPASGQPRARTRFLAVVLAAGLVSLYLHISYSTLALVLAYIGAATCAWFDSPRNYVREYHL